MKLKIIRNNNINGFDDPNINLNFDDDILYSALVTNNMIDREYGYQNSIPYEYNNMIKSDNKKRNKKNDESNDNNYSIYFIFIIIIIFLLIIYALIRLDREKNKEFINLNSSDSYNEAQLTMLSPNINMKFI